MEKVWIYRPVKPAVQSGTFHTLSWILEYVPAHRQNFDPMTGWVGTQDTQGRHKLFFDSLESAIRFAKNNKLAYDVLENGTHTIYPKSYATNFKGNMSYL